MGEDKTLLKFREAKTLTHFIYERLNKIFKSVKIAAKSDKWGGDMPVILDSTTDFNPLNIIASLDRYYSKPVFIIAADTPFIAQNTIQTLFDNLKNHQISLPKSGGFIHNLCGFYRPAVSKIAQNQLLKARNSGDKKLFKIGILRDSCDTIITDFSDFKQFININNPEDYQNAISVAT